jgi:glycosyltransferase involved in cell wall biosynthesis
MRVLFHTNTLNYRGTSVAVTDYARYNQEILGNESVITYCKTNGEEKDMGNEPAVIDALEKEFKVVGYRAGDLEKKIDDNKIDFAYFIRAGNRESLPTNVKTGVHSVFQFNEPHGDRYAYVSKWLSDEMSQGQIPYVPHIVSLPQPKSDFKKFLNIPEDKIVIGRLGGYLTFDIDSVKESIIKLVEKDDRFVFLFVGTEPFTDHENIKFINEIHNTQQKANFINTCDAMIHARQRGESFGLSIAEFLYLNKPVIAWNGGHDRNHLEMLKGADTLYNNEDDLLYIFNNIKDIKEDWTQRVSEFKPETVMNKFKDVFLS